MYYKAEVSGFHLENFCDSKVQILVACSHGTNGLCQCCG